MDASLSEEAPTEIWTVPSRVAVIDVGSNTVRLVAFDYQGRIPQLIFNEKAFCGLGSNMATSNRLSNESMELALETIHRFVTLAGKMDVKHISMVATAAVREAENGAEFVERVHELTGQKLRVISGEEEARYAALGVLAGIPDAHGIAGDLGGGSLELVGIEKGEVRGGESLPLGTLRLMDAHGDDKAKMKKAIDKILAKTEWLSDVQGSDFYLVGGTWRALAKLHMAVRDYPLRILHLYRMDAADTAEFIANIDKYMDDETIAASGMSKKRVPMLPTAALLLDRVLERVKPNTLIISALGVREGILYDHAPPLTRELDPLITFCRDMARRRSRFPEHGDDILDWIAPIFADETPAQNRIRHAVCHLSDISWAGHPDYRAELAMDQIVLAQVMGADHRERAIIGLTLFVLNGGAVEHPSTERIRLLLSDEQINHAKVMGLALRLAQRISGGTRELLAQSTLSMSDKTLTLNIDGADGYMIGDPVERRLNALANALERDAKVHVIR